MIYSDSIKKKNNQFIKKDIIIFIKKIFNFFNLELSKKDNWSKRYGDAVVEIDKKSLRTIKFVNNLMIGSLPNQWSIIQALKYIKNNKVDGDIVETGVFHGGGLIFMNEIMKNIGLKKKMWGYDTFEGIPEIDLKSEKLISGKKLRKETKKDKEIYKDINQVKKILLKKSFNLKTLPTLVVGDTRKTLKKKINLPKKISLVRLDTDFYESTLNELNVLYPKLVSNGILLIDDYGHHKGCKKAVDEFFKSKKKIFIHRIDYTARMIVKK